MKWASLWNFQGSKLIKIRRLLFEIKIQKSHIWQILIFPIYNLTTNELQICQICLLFEVSGNFMNNLILKLFISRTY